MSDSENDGKKNVEKALKSVIKKIEKEEEVRDLKLDAVTKINEDIKQLKNKRDAKLKLAEEKDLTKILALHSKIMELKTVLAEKVKELTILNESVETLKEQKDAYERMAAEMSDEEPTPKPPPKAAAKKVSREPPSIAAKPAVKLDLEKEKKVKVNGERTPCSMGDSWADDDRDDKVTTPPPTKEEKPTPKKKEEKDTFLQVAVRKRLQKTEEEKKEKAQMRAVGKFDKNGAVPIVGDFKLVPRPEVPDEDEKDGVKKVLPQMLPSPKIIKKIYPIEYNMLMSFKFGRGLSGRAFPTLIQNWEEIYKKDPRHHHWSWDAFVQIIMRLGNKRVEEIEKNFPNVVKDLLFIRSHEMMGRPLLLGAGWAALNRNPPATIQVPDEYKSKMIGIADQPIHTPSEEYDDGPAPPYGSSVHDYVQRRKVDEIEA